MRFRHSRCYLPQSKPEIQSLLLPSILCLVSIVIAILMECYTFQMPGYEPIYWNTDYSRSNSQKQELTIRGAVTAQEEYNREDTASITG